MLHKLTLFRATGLFLYLLKTSKTLWCYDAFRGYRKRPVAWNRLIRKFTFQPFVFWGYLKVYRKGNSIKNYVNKLLKWSPRLLQCSLLRSYCLALRKTSLTVISFYNGYKILQNVLLKKLSVFPPLFGTSFHFRTQSCCKLLKWSFVKTYRIDKMLFIALQSLFLGWF